MTIKGKTFNCPVDAAKLLKEKITVAKIAASVIDNCDIHCTNAYNSSSCTATAGEPPKKKVCQGSCSWTGKMKDIALHLDVCVLTKVVCLLTGCSGVFMRADLTTHMQTCEFREECNCPNAECGALFSNKQLLLDHRESCEMETIDCPYHESIGCNYKNLRKDMSAHTSDPTEHLVFIVDTLSQHRDRLQEENSALKLALAKPNRWTRGTYVWTITYNASTTSYVTPVFDIAGFKFRLVHNTRQSSAESKNWASLFLYLEEGWSTRIGADFQIINSNNTAIQTKRVMTAQLYGDPTHGKPAWNFGDGRFIECSTLKSYIGQDKKVTIRVVISIELDNWDAHKVVFKRLV
jgi:hypothetical protein